MKGDQNRSRALKAYGEKQKSIIRLIESIRGRLDAHGKERDITWASVGDLGHVEELLREIEEFFG